MKSHYRAGLPLAALSVLLLGAGVGEPQQRPSLVVMISVDQLRGDLIERYEEAFTGGFRRFLDEGYSFSQASHAHARTHTAPGHATLSTGVFPSRSGIVANAWQQREAGRWRPMYAVEDLDNPILGFENVEALPGRSPKNLLRTGLADWIRAANDDARTLSISSKDRAAITMAGQTRANVYWLLPQLARFITSTYYAQAYPSWVERFNREVMPGIAADRVWDNETPEEFRHLARADSADYEARGLSTFPHISGIETGGGNLQQHNVWAMAQPRADGALLAFARAAMEELELGRRQATDYLAISLSVTDYVGHAYGPFSQEQLDNLIRLDRRLGDFFDYLDETVGEGRWVAGLSADHGVVTMPEAVQEMEGDTGAERLSLEVMNERLATALREASAEGGTEEEIAERLARLIEERGIAERAYTHHDITRGEPADSFAVLMRNSYYPGRATGTLSPYGVEFRYGEGDLVSFPTGTTHGSPYWYDRHVPIMLLGAGVGRGSSDVAVYTVDLAPTLASLAGIPAPDDLDGKPIYP